MHVHRFKNELRKCREAEGVKIEHLAKIMKISKPYLSQLELNTRRISLEDYQYALDWLGYEVVIKKKNGETEHMENTQLENIQVEGTQTEAQVEKVQLENIETEEIQEEYEKYILTIVRNINNISELKLEEDSKHILSSEYKKILDKAQTILEDLKCNNFLTVINNMREYTLEYGRSIEDFGRFDLLMNSIKYVIEDIPDYCKEVNERIKEVLAQNEELESKVSLYKYYTKLRDDLFMQENDTFNVEISSLFNKFDLSFEEIQSEIYPYQRTYVNTKDGEKVVVDNIFFTHDCFISKDDGESYDMLMSVNMDGKIIIENEELLSLFNEKELINIKESLKKVYMGVRDIDIKLDLFRTLAFNSPLITNIK